MRFSLQREALLNTLQTIVGAVEKRHTMPILGNALLRASNNQLTIIATDLEVQLEARIHLDDYVDGGEVTVSARKLLEIVRTLPESGLIIINLDEQGLHINCGKSNFKLRTLPAIDFPNIEQEISHNEFSIQQNELLFLLQNVYFSMALQDVRYYLNGLLLEMSDNALHAIATDGHRLAMSYLSFDELKQQQKSMKFIIPRKGVIELLRLLNANESKVDIAVGQNHIRVIGDNYTFISKLIDGVYPDYEKVIPKNSSKFILVDRDDLKRALSRVSILSNEKFHSVKIFLSNDKLTFETNNADQEQATEELFTGYQGEELEICFNITYIQDIANVLPPGKVSIAFSDGNSSVLINSEGNNSSLFVVMPMRL